MPSKVAKNRKMDKKKRAEENKTRKRDLQRQRREIKAQNMARGKHLEAIYAFLDKAKTIENDLVQAALVDLEETIEKLGEIPKITSKQPTMRGRFR